METFSGTAFPTSPAPLLDLPIRDGNTIASTRFSACSALLDLPIRDGNSLLRPSIVEIDLLLDLPIRDGNRAVP